MDGDFYGVFRGRKGKEREHGSLNLKHHPVPGHEVMGNVIKADAYLVYLIGFGRFRMLEGVAVAKRQGADPYRQLVAIGANIN